MLRVWFSAPAPRLACVEGARSHRRSVPSAHGLARGRGLVADDLHQVIGSNAQARMGRRDGAGFVAARDPGAAQCGTAGRAPTPGTASGCCSRAAPGGTGQRLPPRRGRGRGLRGVRLGVLPAGLARASTPFLLALVRQHGQPSGAVLTATQEAASHRVCRWRPPARPPHGLGNDSGLSAATLGRRDASAPKRPEMAHEQSISAETIIEIRAWSVAAVAGRPEADPELPDRGVAAMGVIMMGRERPGT